MDKTEAERNRRIRNQMYDGKGFPYGDKKVDPSRSRTAAEYNDYLSRTCSHHILAGAHLGMLEAEEVAMGNISYPPGHPRRVSLEAGRDPDVDQLKSEGRWPYESASPEPSSPGPSFTAGFEDRQTPLAQVAAPAPSREAPPLRSNRYAATCASCGGSVEPGKGSMSVEPSKGLVTRHYPSCK